MPLSFLTFACLHRRHSANPPSIIIIFFIPIIIKFATKLRIFWHISIGQLYKLSFRALFLDRTFAEMGLSRLASELPSAISSKLRSLRSKLKWSCSPMREQFLFSLLTHGSSVSFFVFGFVVSLFCRTFAAASRAGAIGSLTNRA